MRLLGPLGSKMPSLLLLMDGVILDLDRFMASLPIQEGKHTSLALLTHQR